MNGIEDKFSQLDSKIFEKTFPKIEIMSDGVSDGIEMFEGIRIMLFDELDEAIKRRVHYIRRI